MPGTSNDDLKAIIERGQSSTSKMLQDATLSIKNIDERLQILSVDVNAKISTLDVKVNTINSTLSTKLDYAMETINRQAAEIVDLQRLSCLSDGVIYGVPLLVNENLNDVFLRFCRKIAFQLDEYNVISVNRQRKPKTNESCPIFIKFLSPAVRNTFFACYLKNMNLTLRDLGFDVDKRVYFNECVSQATQQVYLKAMSFKKNGVLNRVHTYNGHVYVRCTDGTESIRVLNTAHLMSVIDKIQSSKRRLSELQTPNLPQPGSQPTVLQATKVQKTSHALSVTVTANKSPIKPISSPLMPGANTWMSTRSKTNASLSRPLVDPSATTVRSDRMLSKPDLQRLTLSDSNGPDQHLANPFAKSSKTKPDSFNTGIA